MRILVAVCSPYILSHTTDYQHVYNFLSLGQQFPDCEMIKITTPMATMGANISALVQKVATRIPLLCIGESWSEFWLRWHLVTFLPEKLLCRCNVDLVLGYSVPWPFSGNHAPCVVGTNLEAGTYYERANQAHMRPGELRAKRWALRNASIIYTNHPASADRLDSAIPEMAGRVRCISPYLPGLESLSVEEVEKKHKERSVIRLVFVGGEARRKGLVNLMKAWEMLRPDIRSRCEFTVVSNFKDGPVGPLPPDVRPAGQLPHAKVLQVLRDSHVMVLPTLYDTFGTTLVEAMAAGCCVVSSDQEPQDWILDFGRAGALVNPLSPEEIASAIEKVARNPEIRLEMALRGRERFLEQFHHMAVGSKLRDAIFEAVALRKPSWSGERRVRNNSHI